MEWKYESKTKQSTGYEDLYPILDEYTYERYQNASEEERKTMIDEVFKLYRERDIFPIMYYSEEGVINEINKCINREVEVKGTVLENSFSQGQSLCRFLMPNMFKACGNREVDMAPYTRFYNDFQLKRAISVTFRMTKGKSVRPSGVMAGFRLSSAMATNFKAMYAKAIFEKYTPKGGTIYDYSAGFGGRMLGALTSKNDYIYTAVEPCTETYHNLNRLGSYIEKATGRQGSYQLYCEGSEVYKGEPDSIDFSFSSPPYFDLEQYSGEPTQCYNKFPELNAWLDGYMKPTIDNIYYQLKPNAYYAVNIADFKIGKDKVSYVENWVEYSKSIGFELVEVVEMRLTSRPSRKGKGIKHEAIYVFKKTAL